MTEPILRRRRRGNDSDIRAELISHFRLKAVTIERIDQTMAETGLRFGDAAITLGLFTRAEIEEVLLRSSGQAEGTGLIEKAILRVADGRQIIVRHGEPVTPGPQLVIAHDPYNPHCERLRALRTELLLLADQTRDANAIAMLSSGRGEGRSQLAAELAIAFAQLGRRTLLVDADLRNPTQHRLFGATNDQGLSKALRDLEAPLYHPVVGLPQMHVLMAGPIPSNPLELLSDGRFAKLLGEWRSKYEFLVLDTPPVVNSADGIAVATMTGRVLLLSRARHTSFKSTKEIMRRLATTQCRIVGAVLNHF